ncbi:glycosyltransferase [Sphingobium algorifonticola]|nr:glycosyltransferase [Sphingobium algorifonticola]
MGEMRYDFGSAAVGSTMPRLCVCVPARNEADRLPTLLDALAAQHWPERISISLGINNTTDDSLAVIEAARRRHSRRLDLHVVKANFAPALAHAGSARRLAMDAGLAILGDAEDAILVSTDADARPPCDWLAAIAAAFAKGADIVGGRIEIDPAEPLPAFVHQLRAAWDRYWTVVRSIEDSIDPRSWDPAPRHGDHTGASLAVRAEVYRACGGVPLLATGEDRALVDAALVIGARLVHPDTVRTFVSPRLRGRADGGMAVAMQDMFALAQDGGAPMAPSFEQWRKRALWRRALRAGPDGDRLVAQQERVLPPMPCDMPLEIGA